jgi:hypothetical protein
VFVTVRLSAELAIPVGQVPKANGLGVTEAVRITGMPVPLNETGDPFTAAVAVMARLPPYACTAVGLNTTLMVQVEFAANVNVVVVLQVPPAPPAGRENPAGKAPMVMPVAVVTPSFLSVRVWAAVVVLTTTLPYVSADGVTIRSTAAEP